MASCGEIEIGVSVWFHVFTSFLFLFMLIFCFFLSLYCGFYVLVTTALDVVLKGLLSIPFNAALFTVSWRSRKRGPCLFVTNRLIGI